jgi:protein-S-isoprenylcysteine O-methyltransferase Ste14
VIAQAGENLLLGVVCAAFVASTLLLSGLLVEKFGDRYTEYMRAVPGLNLLAGIVRAVMRS